MRILKRNTSGGSGLELISIHIPKTGGRSFRHVLEMVYGDSLDQRGKREDFLKDISTPDGIKNTLSGNIRGIHGHIMISQVEELIKAYNPRIITWVRDPVDRVISNYYFFMKRIREGLVKEKQNRKKDFSLLDYASQEGVQNRMTQILSGVDIKDFFFIGLMERFEEDIKELAIKMGWTENIELPHVNSNKEFMNSDVCTTKYRDIDLEMRNSIAELNKMDIRLYQDIKELRGLE